MSKKKSIGWWIAPFLLSAAFLLLIFLLKNTQSDKNEGNTDNLIVKENTTSHSIINKITPTPAIIPTPEPLTFNQMNALYGPCTNTPVFVYHHIQSRENAIKNKHVSLSTYTETFEEQLKYLQSKSYQTIDIGSMVAFFNGNATIPTKSVILTFDDGYSDFYTNAYPLLQKYNFKAVVFLPTGLVNNTGYLTWEEILDMNKSGSVFFGNHTWSHYATIKDEERIRVEIKTADMQLSEKGLNILKIFAYPYGASTPFSQNYLKSIGYNLAFTTQYGKILCAKHNLSLPRIRMGNLMPSYYEL